MSFSDRSRPAFVVTEAATRIFGRPVEPYFAIGNATIERCRGYPYRISSIENADSDLLKAMPIHWRELLERAHLASVHTVLRCARWVDATVAGYERHNLFGFCSSLRGLMEAGGDSTAALREAPVVFAEQRRAIAAILAGRPMSDGDKLLVHTSRELEDKLIHYTHGRKVGKKEVTPKSHVAEPSYKYIDAMARVAGERTKDLYGELCSIVHPAHMSVIPHFDVEQTEHETRLTLNEYEGDDIDDLLCRYRGEIAGLLQQLNAPLLTIRVLHTYQMFPKVPEMRKFDFSFIREWPRIERALR